VAASNYNPAIIIVNFKTFPLKKETRPYTQALNIIYEMVVHLHLYVQETKLTSLKKPPLFNIKYWLFV